MLIESAHSAPLPYSGIAKDVLDVIYESLLVIYKAREARQSRSDLFEALRRAAQPLDPEFAKHHPRNCDPHIYISATKKKPKTNKQDTSYLPRVSLLCLQSVDRAYPLKKTSSQKDDERVFLPSPLSILIELLTVPTHPESRAYGFALARSILFARFKAHPQADSLPKKWKAISIAAVQEIVESFRTYAKHRDNIPETRSNKVRALLAHFLAMSGVFVLRFGKSKDISAMKLCLRYLESKPDIHANAEGLALYEFRRALPFEDVPDSQEIINTLTGVPLPLGGASTVFFGGMQRSHHNALVASVSGTPGTGKTSFALALAMSMAPFGMRCLYCTFEEDEQTLRRRLEGLSPLYFRRSTLPQTNNIDWFTAVSLNRSAIENITQLRENYISILNHHLTRKVEAIPDNCAVPAIAPLLVVIDSLTTLDQGDNPKSVEEFYKLVRRLRELNCIVLLLSAEDIPKGSRLDYLVDTVIALRHEGTGSAEIKPTRLFQLLKTRLQLSRPGSHIFHLSGDRGVRISPQIPSQLEARKIYRTPLPDQDWIIDTLTSDSKIQSKSQQKKHQKGQEEFELPTVPITAKAPKDRLLHLYPRSRILIHGHGSSGKASLALRILMAPQVRPNGSDDAISNDAIHIPHKHILVVSFLYPQEYYEGHIKEIMNLAHTEGLTPMFNFLVLTPGYIGPEDFIARVLRYMDEGRLSGTPYTGVILDGLHNVFLQFPLLQKSHMVWPSLFSLLGRFNLTIVTTFTIFSTPNTLTKPGDSADQDIVLSGQLPFLHAIVQATDFYLQVERKEEQKLDRVFTISVQSAIHQEIPERTLIWNAETTSFGDFWTKPRPANTEKTELDSLILEKAVEKVVVKVVEQFYKAPSSSAG